MDSQRATNILGQPLETCSLSTMTGFQRDGQGRMPTSDVGRHGVCAQVNKAFLDFTRGCGNDLTSPQPRYGFLGLKPGDRWCLCADRWAEAADHRGVPPVVLSATRIGNVTIADYISARLISTGGWSFRTPGSIIRSNEGKAGLHGGHK